MAIFAENGRISGGSLDALVARLRTQDIQNMAVMLGYLGHGGRRHGDAQTL